MDVEFITCPKCQCKNWVDLPNTEDKNAYRFRCSRCNYTVTLGKCGKCKTEKAWVQTQGIDAKGGLRPVYRYQCRGCGRVVGILIDRLN